MRALYISGNEGMLKILKDNNNNISVSIADQSNKVVIDRSNLVVIFFDRIIDDIISGHIYDVDNEDVFLPQVIEFNNNTKKTDIYKRIVVDNFTVRFDENNNSVTMRRGEDNITIDFHFDDDSNSICIDNRFYPFNLCFEKIFKQIERHADLFNVKCVDIKPYKRKVMHK